MKDYYNILEIEHNASKEDVKRAYFKAIRKYSPERYPEEFMDIREAYETLYEENMRRQYDTLNHLPEKVLEDYTHALEELEQGNPGKSIELLEVIREQYPDFSIINALLGDAYLVNDNSVKAIRIFEVLVKEEPKNSAFAGKLAMGYLNRGWQKKAIGKYKKALELDMDNISLWIDLSYCHFNSMDFNSARRVIEKGIQTSIKHNWDGTDLYFLSLQMDVMLRDYNKANKTLKKLIDFADKEEQTRSNIAWYLTNLSERARLSGNDEFVELFISAASNLLPNDLEIKKTQEQIVEKLELDSMLNQLAEDERYSELLFEALECFAETCDDPECANCTMGNLNYELGLVENMKSTKSQLIRLKKEYPKLYALKKEIFDGILSAKNEEGYYSKHHKRIERAMKKFGGTYENDFNEPWGGFDDDIDYSLDSEPFRREEKKIGRNDPCPCGSGKKYKRCCG